jgi:septal ring factor EnvC (AmiA/AmiB activator)
VPTLEERISTLEGRMTPDLREEMQRGFAETRQEFAAVRAEIARGFERLDNRFDRMDDRMQRQFTWIVSIQLTTMLTVIGVLATAFLRTLKP